MDRKQEAARGGTPYPATAEKNIVDSALAAGRELGRIEVIESPVKDGKPFIVIRDKDGGEKIVVLDERFDKPARVDGTYVLDDAPSFLEYWKRYATDKSVCYASMAPQAQFVAVLDHHGAGEPDYEGHRAVYTLAFSNEWKTWLERNGNLKPFEGNEAFAIWLENQVPDIVQPNGADMLAIALNFKANNNISFGNDVNLANGKAEFTFTKSVEGSANLAGGKVSIPETFMIEIPVFAGINAPKYQMEVRFRYRLGSQRLTLWYELVRPHKVIEGAFKDVLAEIAGTIGKAVLFGKPA